MDFFLSQAIPQVRSGVDADDTVTSWFPEGEALEISERSSPGGRQTLSPPPAPEDPTGVSGAGVHDSCRLLGLQTPPPRELLLVAPPTKHVILGLPDFFLMT